MKYQEKNYMKKMAFAFFLLFLGALIVLNIPVLFAHDEDALLMKIQELEIKLQEQSNKIEKQQKQIQHLKSVLGLPHSDYPEPQ